MPLTPEKRDSFIKLFDEQFGEGAAEQMLKVHDQMHIKRADCANAPAIADIRYALPTLVQVYDLWVSPSSVTRGEARPF